MSDVITVCPACDSCKIRVVETRGQSLGKAWDCRECDHRFETPARRQRRHSGTNDGGSAAVRALLDADPEEVGP